MWNQIAEQDFVLREFLPCTACFHFTGSVVGHAVYMHGNEERRLQQHKFTVLGGERGNISWSARSLTFGRFPPFV